MELFERLHARKEKKKKSQCEENVKLSPTLGDWGDNFENVKLSTQSPPGGPWGTPSISQIKILQKEVHNWTKKLDGRSVQRERERRRVKKRIGGRVSGRDSKKAKMKEDKING